MSVHHFLSKFYLKGFIDDKCIYCFDKNTGKGFPTTDLNGVGGENKFNSIKHETLSEDFVENAQSGLETKMREAFQSLIEDSTLFYRPDNKELILTFIAMVAIRNPSVRKDKNNFLQDLAQQIMIRSPNKNDPLVKKSIDALNQGLIRVEYTKNKLIRDELELWPDFAKWLSYRSWSITYSQNGDFVTCDRPVLLIDKETGELLKYGFRLPNTRIIVPLSKNMALIGDFEESSRIFSCSREFLSITNTLLCRNANRFIYAAENEFIYYEGDELKTFVMHMSSLNTKRNSDGGVAR